MSRRRRGGSAAGSGGARLAGGGSGAGHAPGPGRRRRQPPVRGLFHLVKVPNWRCLGGDGARASPRPRTRNSPRHRWWTEGGCSLCAVQVAWRLCASTVPVTARRPCVVRALPPATTQRGEPWHWPGPVRTSTVHAQRSACDGTSPLGASTLWGRVGAPTTPCRVGKTLVDSNQARLEPRAGVAGRPHERFPQLVVERAPGRRPNLSLGAAATRRWSATSATPPAMERCGCGPEPVGWRRLVR